MSDIEDIAVIEAERGKPDLVLEPSAETIEKQGLSDDIAHEYHLYFDPNAAGGCIVYARYDRGWVVNPSARWPMAEMARRLLNNK
jgi:hypothetical protein